MIESSVFVARIAAVATHTGQLDIIPDAMVAKSYIVLGKGRFESSSSWSHGASRIMSRTATKKRFSNKVQKRATVGIECRKDADVIDEIPMVYKDIDAVIVAKARRVEMAHGLKHGRAIEMSSFHRKGHWRTNAYGTTFWVEGHGVSRDDWRQYSTAPSEPVLWAQSQNLRKTCG